MKLLDDHANGKGTLEPTQIKAIEIVLDRTVPRLSAVEETHINPDDKKSESELRQELISLLKADPTLALEAGYIPAAPRVVHDASQQPTREGERERPLRSDAA
jgi:hypothetical protein